MSALAVVPETTPTLDDLARIANREHDLSLQAGTAMIQHAINAGSALLDAKRQIPRGHWEDWLAQHWAGSIVTAQQMMRVATHKEVVIEKQVTSFKGALRLLHGGRASNAPHPALVAQARKLRREGKTYSDIATELGTNQTAIYRWCNPRAEKERLRKAHARTLAGRRALNRQQRAADAKKAGGAIAESFALVRKALQAAERAVEEAQKPDVRAACNDAMNRLYNAEDALVRASRLS